MNAVVLARRVIWAAIFAGGAAASVNVAATPGPGGAATPLSQRVGGLIDQLGAAEQAKRDETAKQLENFGDAIRPAVLRAAWGAELPEVRGRATRLLAAMSWARSTDPSNVQLALGEYRTPEINGRIAAVGKLAAIENAGGLTAMLRLLKEEPCEDVRWAIVRQMHRFTDEGQLRLIRELDTKWNDPPVLAAVGWAWRDVDGEKGMELLRRAAALSAEHPANNQGELNQILGVLYLEGINTGHPDDAVDAIRQMVWQEEAPIVDPMLTLFTVHAQYGPLKNLERDLRTFGEAVEQPELMFLMGRLAERQGMPLIAAIYYQAAAAANLGNQPGHLRVGDFLVSRGWFDLAQREYELVLESPGEEKEVRDADAHLGLAHCAAGNGQELAAAKQLEKCLDIALKLQGRVIEREREFRAQIDWHYLRDAKERKDWAEAERRVNRLVKVSVPDPEIAIDIVTTLKAVNRVDDAKGVFATFFATTKAPLDADPHNPETLNNIAWLCARCGEHLEDAYRWSSEAAKRAPSNAAYLDTAAEAAADMGKWEEAVRYESTALKLTPGDRFMTLQLRRFEEGRRTAAK